MAEAQLPRARRGAEARRAGPDDRDLDAVSGARLAHARAPARRRTAIMLLTNMRTGILIPPNRLPLSDLNLDATRTYILEGQAMPLNAGKGQPPAAIYEVLARRSQQFATEGRGRPVAASVLSSSLPLRERYEGLAACCLAIVERGFTPAGVPSPHQASLAPDGASCAILSLKGRGYEARSPRRGNHHASSNISARLVAARGSKRVQPSGPSRSSGRKRALYAMRADPSIQ
jgi:hypothetical protein